jgi:adenosylmethionine-8-amino-7-oxononanoate aminotransferase
MNDFIILGTDTNVGKTTFALLWLQAFADQWEYWKPIETGESDSAAVARLVPAAVVHPARQRFETPAAPLLAARQKGAKVLAANQIADAIPRALNVNRGLVIESFGSPFSPLNDDELQLALILRLNRPSLLVSSTTLGSVGRTLQCLTALRSEGIVPFAIVLLGKRDPFAEEQVRQHVVGNTVVSLEPPDEWSSPALAICVERQRAELERLRAICGIGFQSCQLLLSNDKIGILSHDDRRCVWHPYTSLLDTDEPLNCIGAHDEFLVLADGRKIIDGISSWWTILHGHRHPPLMRALADAASRIDHVLFAGVTHPYAIELAELLLGTMPWCGGRVFYSDNGSTAVEVALKMAYQFWCHHDQPTRTRFVGFTNGYHGDTFGAMAVSRDPVFFGRFEPLLFQADILPLDAARLDEHLTKYREQIAAVILEPIVQGAGGMRMHTPELLRQIVEITQRHGVLFIADEVMTGGGRTGTLWAHQAAGVAPDLLCAAKTLTGGILPLAVTLVAPKIVSAFQTADRSRTFFHGHSFTANPLACAVAASNVRRLLADPPNAPQRIERFWTHALQSLRDHPKVKDVRIRCSIAAVEIDAEGGYLAEIGRTMRRACLERGVLLRPLGSVLYALPPYCTTTASLQKIADAMIAAVESV